uniref:CARD domain-containing protein n=1 Tax=Amphimedon queenslandica TaxID=400682 RepID=A0A1X7T1X5_AMPQE
YDGYIELKFDAPQDEPFTGWSIKPHLKPCRFLRCDVDKFGEANYPLPSTCLISVYGSPGAVPSLHYSIPLDGVADPKTLFIHRSLRTTPSLTNPSSPSSSSNVVDESTSVPETSSFTSEIAHRVMTECTTIIKSCGINIHFLVDKLLEHNIINAREKREITDGYTKQTAGERMDELLHIISSSISMDGKVFGIFLDILRKEGTLRTIGLADKLMDKYKSI